MDLPPGGGAVAQVSRCYLQSEETLGICHGVSERSVGAPFTIDGRRWSFVTNSRGGAVTLTLKSLDLGPNEFGVANVKIVDRRQNPPVAHSPIRCLVYRGQATQLQLPTVAELAEKGIVFNDSLAIAISAHVFP
jgi:hypothetical protein